MQDVELDEIALEQISRHLRLLVVSLMRTVLIWANRILRSCSMDCVLISAVFYSRRTLLSRLIR